MPLSGCTADSGSPAAELRSVDRSNAVRERPEPGEWPADRDDPDASDSFPAAQPTERKITHLCSASLMIMFSIKPQAGLLRPQQRCLHMSTFMVGAVMTDAHRQRHQDGRTFHAYAASAATAVPVREPGRPSARPTRRCPGCLPRVLAPVTSALRFAVQTISASWGFQLS